MYLLKPEKGDIGKQTRFKERFETHHYLLKLVFVEKGAFVQRVHCGI